MYDTSTVSYCAGRVGPSGPVRQELLDRHRESQWVPKAQRDPRPWLEPRGRAGFKGVIGSWRFSHVVRTVRVRAPYLRGTIEVLRVFPKLLPLLLATVLANGRGKSDNNRDRFTNNLNAMPYHVSNLRRGHWEEVASAYDTGAPRHSNPKTMERYIPRRLARLGKEDNLCRYTVRFCTRVQRVCICVPALSLESHSSTALALVQVTVDFSLPPLLTIPWGDLLR
ncbi:hypothetical protein C7212DRAFT_347276 [Tuber magnatum]|uniref:Uncharacterized protein n=1 Tax=Tuber magnatum TaxID=42249 RepID=A0A317SI75_9PEZI|nr:hypothetical protein C7212DRAFT_347276 [Tuber magnatum]